jgi:5,5'-dehydrodivanillate O-demethylase
MLTEQENERITRVGPGTPMGNMLRRYWHPIAAAEDLEREDVLPVRILGENLVLYKTTNGAYGLIQERCPHRSTSLAYGIPDADGIRCPYHGWYFNATGNCLEQPFDDVENPDSTFKDKIHVDAYPVRTLGGLVWTYMGPPDRQPLLPRWDAVAREDLDRRIGITHLPCNWLQCMENSLDPVHFEWLHANLINYVAKRRGQEPVMFPARHRRIAFDRFEYGIYKRRLLEGDDPNTSPDWLVGHPVLFPNTLDTGGSLQIRVPIDDHNTLHFLYTVSPRAAGEPEKLEVYDLPNEHEDGRLVVETVIGTDMMAWVTQGPTTPRQLEHLGVSDRGIIMYRSALSDAIDAVERGEDPPGLVRNPEDNFPWIDIKWEEKPREAYRMPGEKDRRARLAALAPEKPAHRRTVSALTPRRR